MLRKNNVIFSDLVTHTADSENTAILNLLLAPGENYFFLYSVFLLKFNAVQNK